MFNSEIMKYMESSFDPKTLIEVESLRIKKTPLGIVLYFQIFINLESSLESENKA